MKSSIDKHLEEKTYLRWQGEPLALVFAGDKKPTRITAIEDIQRLFITAQFPTGDTHTLKKADIVIAFKAADARVVRDNIRFKKTDAFDIPASPKHRGILKNNMTEYLLSSRNQQVIFRLWTGLVIRGALTHIGEWNLLIAVENEVTTGNILIYRHAIRYVEKGQKRITAA